MRNKLSINHICIVLSENSTSEHAYALAAQAANLGVRTCFINLNRKIVFTWLTIFYYRCHILFYRSSYLFLNTPYKEHQPKWLTKVNFQFAYAGYGLKLTNWESGQFSGEMISKCKLLIADSEYDFLGYNKLSKDSKKILLVGNPLMWQIRDQKLREPIKRFKVKQILWAPHWSQSWFEFSRGYSRWLEKAATIYEVAKSNPEIKFVFRPHPILRYGLFEELNKNNKIYHREIQNSLDTEKVELEIKIIKEFLALPNVTLSTGTMSEDIFQSDALITSGLSIIGYWATTGKPMAIYRDSDTPPMGVNGEKLLLSSEIVNNTSELLTWMQKIINLDNFEINHSLVKSCEEIFPTFTKSPMQLILES